MKHCFALFALAAAISTPAFADANLASAKNCMACHTVEKKRVGPSFKDIAHKYAGQSDATAQLAQKIVQGSRGVWGPVPMPANNQVSPADAQELATWVLSLQ